MAGDWIKMRTSLFTHPKVVRMSSALSADALRTVGGLMSAWCLFDAHSESGRLDGYTMEALDEHVRWRGFAAAMESVGWLKSDAQGIELPEFSNHNGQSAKRRAHDAERKRQERKDRKESGIAADESRTREEKRREEKSSTSNNPASVQIPEGAEALAHALQSMGYEHCSPRSPDVQAMAAQGVTPEELRDASAGKQGKPIAYLVARVIGKREDRAAASATGSGTAPATGAGQSPAEQHRHRRWLAYQDRVIEIRHRHQVHGTISDAQREELEQAAWDEYHAGAPEAVS